VGIFFILTSLSNVNSKNGPKSVIDFWIKFQPACRQAGRPYYQGAQLFHVIILPGFLAT